MGIVLLPILGTVNALMARKKGYSGVLWFFCAGLLGLIALLTLPNTNAEGIEQDEVERLRRRGNNIGGVILAVGLGLGFLLMIAAASA